MAAVLGTIFTGVTEALGLGEGGLVIGEAITEGLTTLIPEIAPVITQVETLLGEVGEVINAPQAYLTGLLEVVEERAIGAIAEAIGPEATQTLIEGSEKAKEIGGMFKKGHAAKHFVETALEGGDDPNKRRRLYEHSEMGPQRIEFNDINEDYEANITDTPVMATSSHNRHPNGNVMPFQPMRIGVRHNDMEHTRGAVSYGGEQEWHYNPPVYIISQRNLL